ncbi:glycosyltransferase family 4 protein [Tabrizicola sp.]|uniref:glycosyltransferase family 4 protein n=1 Tax=Tabrizicola sp. TaxID=2005166 RepID=UPI00286D2FAB|nr:glycosyltransferase family 4 protein [Tabrizicola sp.]
MKLLFVHQNFPGQFLYLAPEMQRRGHDCRVLTDAKNQNPSDIPVLKYSFSPKEVDPAATRLGRNYTAMSDRGVVIARAARKLRDEQGYVPDVIFGHSGWGETLFLKEVWPEAKLLVYAEFYYHGVGGDVGFDLEFSVPSFDQVMIAQGRAAYLAQALLHADRGLSPTEWQASRHPPKLREMIDVIFDGVDCDRLAPNPLAQFTLPNGSVLKVGDEVLTFVNRNLEPYRGFHVFMRALPAVLAARPEAQVVIVGGNEVSYGFMPKEGGNWKDKLLAEVGDKLDLDRVHFVGKLPYDQFVDLMHVGRAHAYLTYPFVLSWSMVEAMACGALVVGSRTAPVQEVIRDGVNGRLVEFFDVESWSKALIEVLAEPERFTLLRSEAIETARRSYDLRTICLPKQISLLTSLESGQLG